MNFLTIKRQLMNSLDGTFVLPFLKAEGSIILYRHYQALQVSIVLILVLIGIRILRAKTSQIQLANLVLVVFSIFLMIGYFLEQTTTNIEAMGAAIKVEYFGQAGVMMSIMWLTDLFCDRKVNPVLYRSHLLLWAILLTAIFNFEKGTFFYKSFEIYNYGSYAIPYTKAGFLFYVCYISNLLVLIRAELLCYRKLKRSIDIEKRRCYWILLSPVFPVTFTFLKWTGLTKGFDLMALGLLGFIICLSSAILNYDYLNSVMIETEIDELTGLSNRNYFVNNLKVLLKNQTSGTFLMLDMDNFKFINDNYGHGMGDKALALFGETLKDILDEKHHVCRFGGDEFCIFLEGVTDREKATQIFLQIKNHFYEKQYKELFPSKLNCSGGIYIVYENCEESFEKVYENADKALYLAKNSGKSQCRLYN